MGKLLQYCYVQYHSSIIIYCVHFQSPRNHTKPNQTGMRHYYYSSTILLVASLALGADNLVAGFSNAAPPGHEIASSSPTAMGASSTPQNDDCGRRQWCSKAAATVLATTASMVMTPLEEASAAAADAPQKMFAPGGTLVDYQVGVTVGNNRASKSRRNDNSNVVFGQDYYYKFGTAPAFIPKGDISFPVKMPFVLSQQRYDNLNKYRERVQRGIDKIASLRADFIDTGNYAEVPEAETPEYSIRPFGLLANGFMASENTGTTNELFLARWYINEVYLDINDVKKASSKEEAELAYSNAILALNSLLGMLNRSITPKVGDPFELL